ncbi:MAG: outer membrane protein transport protein [Gammaproteobacteria bacterium]|nr:outer membrane protein transport protein [Gammaproteobacteria bacterium]
MNKPLKIAISASTFATALCLTSTTYASGFAIIENGASGMGQAFAGAAAVAEDPSTIYFNPAGMMYLKGTQVTTGMHIIKSDAEFKDKGSTNLTAFGVSQGNDGGNAGDTFYVPNFYYVRDFGEKYKIGLGVNAPFGLGTEYKDGWMGRYAATNSELTSMNFNPSIAFRANEKLSIGLGMNIQYLDATLEKDIYQFGLPAPFAGTPDGSVKVEGDSWEFGFNAGFIYEITSQTRLGIHYRSEISHTLEGDIKYEGISQALTGNPLTAPKFINQDARANIDTPSTLSVSLTHQLNDRLTLLGDITHTKWSNFEELSVVGDNGVEVTQVDEKWDDSYRISAGIKYQYNSQWILRTGIAHDETPIDDKHRTARIPGDDRTWLSFGASYSPSKSLTVDVGYSHLWVEDAEIDEDYPLLTASGTLKGEFDADVDILSVQATWKF